MEEEHERHGEETTDQEGRGPRCQRQLPRDVRLHGLRVLRRGRRESRIPQRQRIRVADAVADDIRHRLPDAPARCRRAGRLHRSARPARRPDREPRHHVRRRCADRLHADLRVDRHGRANPRRHRASAPGLLGRCRIRGGLRLSLGDRLAGSPRLLRELAVGESAGRRRLRGSHRCDAARASHRGTDDRLGLAHPVPDRLPDRPGAVLDPAFDAGERRIRPARQAPARHARRDLPLAPAELGHRAEGRSCSSR